MFWRSKPHLYGEQLKKHLKLLEEGDTRAIPWLFCIFAGKHDPFKAIVAKALCAVLDNLTFDEVVRVDEQMRQTTSMEWFIDWRMVSVESFFTHKMNDSDRCAVTVFASFNPNGFIRERAVKMMKDYSGTLPYIILRQNDWVNQVRQAAMEASDYRMKNLSAGELLSALPFAAKLSRSGRAYHDINMTCFFSALTSSANAAVLAQGLAAPNIRVRLICTNALLNSQNLSTDLAFMRLKTEPDPFLRAIIFRRLKDIGQNMESAVSALLKDKHPRNRILSFQYLCDTYSEQAYDTAERLLLDKNAIVRENARAFIKKQKPDIDFLAFYREHIENNPVTSILGLGETGTFADADSLEPFLNSSGIGVTKAAMTAIMRLDNKKYRNTITEMLTDERAGIVKTAQNLIIKYGSANYLRVREILHSTGHGHTKLKCLAILLTASKWERLIYILEAMSFSDDKIKEITLGAIRLWLQTINRSYALPNDSQVEKIQSLIKDLSSILSSDLKRELLFVLPEEGVYYGR
jgi:hypothetical protein